MRNRCRIVKEERPVLVFLHKLKCSLMDQFRGILFKFISAVTFQNFFFLVIPEVIRIVVMGHPLAVESVKFIKALFVWITFRTGISQSPFPESSSDITRCFHQFRNGNGVGRQGPLPFFGHLFVTANWCMARCQTCHQR